MIEMKKKEIDLNLIPDNSYLLLTPGPLSTSKSVKASMLRDWCTWDDDYNQLVQSIRSNLVGLATKKTKDYTAVLMQGSGTFSVESVIGSVVPQKGKLLILSNGAYGDRIAEIAKVLKIPVLKQNTSETCGIDLDELKENLADYPGITHVAVVHSETTTGMLNDIKKIGKIVKEYKKVFIVDAMSSFGGIPMDMDNLKIDYLISSANKCIQGVPGFGFIIAKTKEIEKIKGNARSLSLDLYDQWKTMEKNNGKWRYTSPTHVVRAFSQALAELMEEGGVQKRFERYSKNQKLLREGMEKLGFKPSLPEKLQSPIITSFCYPEKLAISFKEMYDTLKLGGYVIYPGKISKAETFSIGNIGEVYESDILGLLKKVEEFVETKKR